MQKYIGIIGLGTIGTPIAQRLLEKKYSLLVYDLVSDKMKHLVGKGAVAVSSALETAARSGVIISILPQPAETEALVLGDAGILSELGEGKIFIDMSTSSLDLTYRLYEEIEKRKGEMLDAPVSGGHIKARNGKLAVIVGGRKKTFKKCEKLLNDLGESVHYTGRPGNGHLFKLLNNLLYSVNMCAAAEILTLGEKMGLELSRMVEIFNSASAASYCLEQKVPTFVFSDNFTPGMSTQLLLKDMELALKLGENTESLQVFGNLAYQFYKIALNSGFGGEDNSAVIKVFRSLGNKERV